MRRSASSEPHRQSYKNGVQAIAKLRYEFPFCRAGAHDSKLAQGGIAGRITPDVSRFLRISSRPVETVGIVLLAIEICEHHQPVARILPIDLIIFCVTANRSVLLVSQNFLLAPWPASSGIVLPLLALPLDRADRI